MESKHFQTQSKFSKGDCQLSKGAINSEEELEEEQAGPTPPAQQGTTLPWTLPQWYLKTLLDLGVTEFPTSVHRNVKPPHLTTRVIEPKSFKQAKDVPQ